MRVLSFLFFLIVSSAVFLTGAFYVIARVISNISFNPESKAWKMTIGRLRERLNTKVAPNLIPWDHEMLPLLSMNKSKAKKPGFFDSVEEGVFTTIFQEPVLAYVTQKSGKDSVTVARTSDREIIFRKKGDKETEIWLNGQPFALYTEGKLIAAGRQNNLLAYLENREGQELAVVIGNKTAAALGNPERQSGPNPRALSLVKDVDAQEENMLLAMTLLHLTR
jgi:hypothetical protein